jgi:hypothetical protein
MNDLKFAFRQLWKNPDFEKSDEWLVMSDERGTPPAATAHHLSLITHHCGYE